MAVEKFPVEAGHIMMFARSVGDANPIYADESYAKTTETGGENATPTFIQASSQYDPDASLRPKIGQKWFGSGAKPSGSNAPAEESLAGDAGGTSGGGTGLHGGQHYTYHQNMKPGDVLTAESKPGQRWEKESKRAGKLIFSESITEYKNQNGELVVTARSVGIQTERVVDQG
jgi:hypothetical protein